MKLHNLPRVDEILSHPRMLAAAADVPRHLARDAARDAIQEVRSRALAGELVDDTLDAIAAAAVAALRGRLTRSLRRCVNATGVILHTGLGRAPLSEAARHALAEVASGYSNLQADVGSGERMPREVHVEHLIRELTGAEVTIVVNNNAAATVLVLNTLAAGREVIVSRGEMVEIGGAFRIPDIIALSGCRLVEVGCTNRTHLRDYRRAITADTALLLAVHQSNYRITGFASQPALSDLTALAHEHSIPCAHDLGSGALLDLAQFGLPHEPSVPESLGAGADVVFFSGDKLLGGPQCGIIVGKPAVLDRMRSNPFYRTFRVDKLTLAALEATLRLFRDTAALAEQHQVMRVLTAPPERIRERAEALAARLREACNGRVQVTATPGESAIGGGSLAGHSLPTVVVTVRSHQIGAGEIASRLRLGDPPIFARVHDDAVLIDPRTVLLDEEVHIISAFQRITSSPDTKR